MATDPKDPALVTDRDVSEDPSHAPSQSIHQQSLAEEAHVQQ